MSFTEDDIADVSAAIEEAERHPFEVVHEEPAPTREYSLAVMDRMLEIHEELAGVDYHYCALVDGDIIFWRGPANAPMGGAS